ncbi:hypothetical protein MPH_10524 [Macrophomina phaseolina MS6]|uniref:Uncharacterized protein n=1 Tax=Macrophomina phaseolina (strain MS6) TaxID=1126212 RepID=K2RHR5_MACPH|nr:hypothetical protein MPH_10524 [Macrophomina phaseolina MS6]
MFWGVVGFMWLAINKGKKRKVRMERYHTDSITWRSGLVQKPNRSRWKVMGQGNVGRAEIPFVRLARIEARSRRLPLFASASSNRFKLEAVSPHIFYSSKSGIPSRAITPIELQTKEVAGFIGTLGNWAGRSRESRVEELMPRSEQNDASGDGGPKGRRPKRSYHRT